MRYMLGLAAWICSAASLSPEAIRGLTQDHTFLKGQVTAVIFISAQCPVSNAYGDRLEALYKEYTPKGVRFLFVDSNATETAEQMAANAKEHGFTFPIYQDPSSLAAEQFHAQATPETFVLDKQGAIRYHGAVDDAQNPARVKHSSLREALDAMLTGRAVATPETKAFGCTIKRPRKVS
jgi:peroxiredoxin